VREAISARIKLEAILVQSARAEEWERDLAKIRTPIYEVNSEAFERITKLENTQGIVAVGKIFQLPTRESSFTVACEQVSDPGNCGALIRVADFFGAAELHLGPDSADIFNSKVVRGSMGSIFHQPIKEQTDIEELIQSWKGTSIALVSHDGEPLKNDKQQTTNDNNPTLLVLGHETRGLSDDIANLCTKKVTLERKGHAESLNLVTAAAVAAYALTQ
jgi:TrmH family RNA methyltransferase